MVRTSVSSRFGYLPHLNMWSVALVTALVVAFGSGQPAAPCDGQVCKPPGCRCSSSEIPGGLQSEETPQVILLSFDSSLTYRASEAYRQLIDAISANPNGCPARVTFFVSHDFTNYSTVNEWYNKGHEIASNSITHRTDGNFWLNATMTTWVKEMVDMRIMFQNFANIPSWAVSGARSPFLITGGNEMYGALYDNQITWDCSWSSRQNPGIWPYTLDYRSTQDCPGGRCPSNSFPGTWVIPIVNLNDTGGNSCNLLDTCSGGTTNVSVYNFLKTNFDRHYNGNRSPFGLYVHFGWLQVEAHRQGLLKFLDSLVLYDAYLVTASQLIEWVKHPVRTWEVPDFEPWSCGSAGVERRNCSRTECEYDPQETPNGLGKRVMTICDSPCPQYYPWFDNVEGCEPYDETPSSTTQSSPASN